MSQCEDRSPGEEDVAEAVHREMEKMESAIRDAVERFTAMLEDSRARDTGTQLEVRPTMGRMVIKGNCACFNAEYLRYFHEYSQSFCVCTT